MQGHKQEADAVTSIEPVNKCCSCCVYALIDYAYVVDYNGVCGELVHC